MLKTKKEIENWLSSNYVNNYVIREDLSVSVGCNVDLRDLGLTKLPVKFNKINGNFNISHNLLEDMIGMPNEVDGDFSIRGNKIQSLLGSPQYISGVFDCSQNKLENLNGITKDLKYDINISYNELTSLKGCPSIINGDLISKGNNFTTLEFGPDIVFGTFDISFSKIKDLSFFPKEIKNNAYLLGIKNLDVTNLICEIGQDLIVDKKIKNIELLKFIDKDNSKRIKISGAEFKVFLLKNKLESSLNNDLDSKKTNNNFKI